MVLLRLAPDLDDKKWPLMIVDCGTQRVTQTESFCWPFHQIVCCSQGEGRVKVEDKDYGLTPGSVFYMQPNMEHEYSAPENSCHVSWVSFNGQWMDTLPGLFGFHPELKSAIIQDRLFPDIHLRITSILENMDEIFVRERSSVALYGILVEFFLQYKHSRNASGHDFTLLIEKAVEDMKSHIYDVIEIGALASRLGVCRQHLSRSFKKRYNVGSKEFYLRLKVDQGKQDIVHFPEMSIKDIGFRLGFINASHFARVFHTITGVTPSAFRSSYRSRHLLEESHTDGTSVKL